MASSTFSEGSRSPRSIWERYGLEIPTRSASCRSESSCSSRCRRMYSPSGESGADAITRAYACRAVPCLPVRGRSVEGLTCEPQAGRPAGKVQQQEPDKLRRLRGESCRTWWRELLVERSHLLTRCDGRQQGLEFVVGGPLVTRVQGARLSSEPLVLRLGLRQARRR